MSWKVTLSTNSRRSQARLWQWSRLPSLILWRADWRMALSSLWIYFTMKYCLPTAWSKATSIRFRFWRTRVSGSPSWRLPAETLESLRFGTWTHAKFGAKWRSLTMAARSRASPSFRMNPFWSRRAKTTTRSRCGSLRRDSQSQDSLGKGLAMRSHPLKFDSMEVWTTRPITGQEISFRALRMGTCVISHY